MMKSLKESNKERVYNMYLQLITDRTRDNCVEKRNRAKSLVKQIHDEYGDSLYGALNMMYTEDNL